MKIVAISDAKLAPAFGIDMASIEAFAGAGVVAGSYGRVAPGRETAAHHHDETEAFVVLAGRGEVVSGAQPQAVGPGTVVVFEPFENHVLRNLGDQELLFVDLYWRDSERTAQAAKASGLEQLKGRPIFVFSTPPTPNGDLHLGHLSGPYLGADVYVRFQRMNGMEAYHLTGSDDFQSYVVGRARQEQSTPSEVAARYAAEIKATLDLMEIPVDQYTITNASPGYREGLQAFFSRIVAAGIGQRAGAALFDGQTGAYLYEVDVAGQCPTCGAATSGNICEECGEPNTCVELVAPHSKLSNLLPGAGTIERYSLPLHEYRGVVFDHHRRSKVSPRLQHLAARVLERPEFHLPITHPANWGIPPAQEGDGQQVIWVWPEMAFGFLYGIAELGRRMGRDWRADRPQADWKLVHFFGYDNSFYHAILFPILYSIAYPEWRCDIDYNVNEFYLLDGQKFSTSRRHAIWGKEIVSPRTVDAIRYYLALTRGENIQANFSLDAFNRQTADVLIGRWQGWFTDLGSRVNADFAGVAHDAGSWTPRQTAFLHRLQLRLDAVTAHYSPNGFSLNAAAAELNGMVDDAVGFSRVHVTLRTNIDLRDEYRTAMALELAAARLLALCAAPLMPRFAASLAASLGGISIATWPRHVTLVAPGSRIDLAKSVFFAAPSTSQPGFSDQEAA